MRQTRDKTRTVLPYGETNLITVARNNGLRSLAKPKQLNLENFFTLMFNHL